MQALAHADDTFVIQQAKYSQQLLQNVNAIDLHIHLTTTTVMAPSPSWTL